MTTVPEIVLASTSRYRADLLGRLRIPFRQLAPSYVESSRTGESPKQMAVRLADGKARSLLGKVSDRAVIIGCDQVAHLGEHLLGKPGHLEGAKEQLGYSSGNWVTFTTAVTLIASGGRHAAASEDYRIRFRSLSSQEIDDYLTLEKPFDCAGSLKAEGLGITLLEDACGRDITTLLGLPLMLLREQFIKLDIDLTRLIPRKII